MLEFDKLKSWTILTSGPILVGSCRNISFSTETDASTHYIYSSNKKITVSQVVINLLFEIVIIFIILLKFISEIQITKIPKKADNLNGIVIFAGIVLFPLVLLTA